MQHILKPTRIRDNQNQNILDLLITNGDIVENTEFLDTMEHSNHVVLKFNYALMDYIDCCTNPIFYFDKSDYDKLRNSVQTKLRNIIINNESDVNSAWNQITLIIHEKFTKYVPIVKTMSNNKKVHKKEDDLKMI